jgi:hypothetical protein
VNELDDTMPTTERPGVHRAGNGAPPKTPADLRHEGLTEFFGAVEEAIESLGNEVAETKLDVRHVLRLCKEIGITQAEIQSSQRLLAESHRRMTDALVEIRDRLRGPESAPPSLGLSGDRTSEQQ